MRNEEEKALYDWMDALDPDSLKDLENISLESGANADRETLQRIKNKTRAKLGLAPAALPTRAPRTGFKRGYAAAAVILMVLIAIGAASPTVRAHLHDVLRFIPGFGVVQEADPSGQQTFVLEQPVSVPMGKGRIEIKGFMLSGTEAWLTISGESTTPPESVKVTVDGKSYALNQSTSVTAGAWQADYWLKDSIPLSDKSTVTLKLADTAVGPLSMKEARAADSLQGLGASDVRNGVQLTAVVTRLTDERVRVNLFSELPGTLRAESYGKEPIGAGLQLQLKDERGGSVDIEKDQTFLNPKELVFTDQASGNRHYSLTIPSIAAVDPGARRQKVTVPIPSQGSEEWNQTVELAGFPVQFAKIERVDASNVALDVDSHFDPEQPQTLQSFKVLNRDGVQMSYTWKVDEMTKAIQQIILPVEPNAKQLTFYIDEPQIVLKGPWVLDIAASEDRTQ